MSFFSSYLHKPDDGHLSDAAAIGFMFLTTVAIVILLFGASRLVISLF